MPLLKSFCRAFFFTLFISKTFGQESKFPVLADELKLIETQLLKAQELSIKLRDPQKNIQKILEEDPLTSFNKKNREFLSKNLSSRQIAQFSVEGTHMKIQSFDKLRNPITIDVDFHYIYRNRISINEQIFNLEIRKNLSYNYEKYFLPALKNFDKKEKTAFEKVIFPILEIVFSLQACQSEDKNKNLNAGSIGIAALSVACDCLTISNPTSIISASGYAVYEGAKKGVQEKSFQSFCKNTFTNLPGVRSLVACNEAWKVNAITPLSPQAESKHN